MAKQLVVDPKRCVSCRTCELVCSFQHHGEFNPRLSNVSVFAYEHAAVTVPVMCLQCEEACCKEVCPTGALSRNEEGVIVHDESKCIVCKMCVSACPLGNMSFSPRTRKAPCSARPEPSSWWIPTRYPTKNNLQPTGSRQRW